MSCGCKPMLPVDAACMSDAVGSSVGGPVPVKAREGRQHQRYSPAGERLVAGYALVCVVGVQSTRPRCSRCIPYRVNTKAAPTINDAQVLLVSSRGGKAWSFPKVCHAHATQATSSSRMVPNTREAGKTTRLWNQPPSERLWRSRACVARWRCASCSASSTMYRCACIVAHVSLRMYRHACIAASR